VPVNQAIEVREGDAQYRVRATMSPTRSSR
jgi:hypothetical protein